MYIKIKILIPDCNRYDTFFTNTTLVHTLQLQKNANKFPYVLYPYAIAAKKEVCLDLKITFTFRKYAIGLLTIVMKI
jgi:hypothetical protein